MDIANTAERVADVKTDGDDEFDYDEQLVQKIYSNDPEKDECVKDRMAGVSAHDGDNTDVADTEVSSNLVPKNEICDKTEDTATSIIIDDSTYFAVTSSSSPPNDLWAKITTQHNDVIKSDDNEETKDNSKLSHADEEYEQATDEWDDLQQITPTANQQDPTTTTKVTFEEALQHFDAVDMKAYENKITPAIKRSRFASVLQNLSKGKLHKSLVAERNLIFTLALVQLENADRTHVQILQTIFKTLTKRTIDCSRFGSHWELIGFQGNDPATDLRGCGMLGLLTVLRFVTSVKSKALAAKVYQLSRDEIQNFPFCVMSINVTRISLQVLREGKLNKECNQRLKQKSQKYRSSEFDNIVIDVLQDLYVAIFHRIYTVWKNEGKTMTESGFVVRDVEDYAKSKPMLLLKHFNKSHGSDKRKSRNQDDTNDKIESFVGVDEL